MWEIVKLAHAENKREISLNGAQLTELLEQNDGNVDNEVFRLKQLNLLRLSNSPAFVDIPGDLQELTQLQSLLLYGNKLDKFPSKIVCE